MRHVALEDRHLDAVIAGVLDRPQQRQMLVADMRRPEQQVEADPHQRPRRSVLTTSRQLRIGPAQRRPDLTAGLTLEVGRPIFTPGGRGVCRTTWPSGPMTPLVRMKLA